MKKIPVLTSKIEKVLTKLSKLDLLKNFYLAGGTGLALEIGHRKSYDLDFFTQKRFSSNLLKSNISKFFKVYIVEEDQDTLILNVNNVKISFFKYDYPVLFKFRKFNGIKIADPRDIGCMKISAISSRGTKRDFIDLYFICKNITPLEKLLNLFQKKYKRVKYNPMHILKSLIYFKDAEDEPMPKMIIKVKWSDVKNFFVEEVKKLENALK